MNEVWRGRVERAAFLETLRRQLRRAPGPPASAVPRSPGPGRVRGDQERLALFVARLQELGVIASVVPARADARAAIERLALERGWSTISCATPLRWPAIAGRWTADPREAPFGLAEAELAVAETGTVLLSNHGPYRRGHSLLPPSIGLIVPQARIVTGFADALRWIAAQGPKLPACLSFVTGPSNTADIASVQVVGVHGPGEVFVWVVANDEEEASPMDGPVVGRA
jgi:L-lactate dehydrogenase complex protein LldG